MALPSEDLWKGNMQFGKLFRVNFGSGYKVLSLSLGANKLFTFLYLYCSRSMCCGCLLWPSSWAPTPTSFICFLCHYKNFVGLYLKKLEEKLKTYPESQRWWKNYYRQRTLEISGKRKAWKSCSSSYAKNSSMLFFQEHYFEGKILALGERRGTSYLKSDAFPRSIFNWILGLVTATLSMSILGFSGWGLLVRFIILFILLFSFIFCGCCWIFLFL